MLFWSADFEISWRFWKPPSSSRFALPSLTRPLAVADLFIPPLAPPHTATHRWTSSSGGAGASALARPSKSPNALSARALPGWNFDPSLWRQWYLLFGFLKQCLQIWAYLCIAVAQLPSQAKMLSALSRWDFKRSKIADPWNKKGIYGNPVHWRGHPRHRLFSLVLSWDKHCQRHNGPKVLSLKLELSFWLNWICLHFSFRDNSSFRLNVSISYIK